MYLMQADTVKRNQWKVQRLTVMYVSPEACYFIFKRRIDDSRYIKDKPTTIVKAKTKNR